MKKYNMKKPEEKEKIIKRYIGGEPAMKLADEYEEYDALKRFNLKPKNITEIKGCKCGQVLTGKIKPKDCPLFDRRCTPENPVGPCMVSGEGTCAAYYKFMR